MKRFKHLSVVAISGVCVIGLIGFSCLTTSMADAAAKEKKPVKQATIKKSGPAPVVMVTTPVVTLASKVSLTFIGSGFEPEKEITILLKDEEGSQSDITLIPAPKTDKAGAFITRWQADDFIKAKLVKEGVSTIIVTDDKFVPLALTPVSFVADKARDEKPKDDKAKGEKKAKDDKEKK